MKILLLGGTGVLSTDVAKEIIRHSDELYILNRGNHAQIEAPAVHIIIGDIRDKDNLKTKIVNLFFDVVVDFLSFEPEQLESTYKFFAPLCKQYIFISSCCVFRRSKEDGVISEESIKPSELLYGKNKYLCEVTLQKIAQNGNCNYTIVRPYITYGNTRLPVPLAPVARLHWTIIGRILSGKPYFHWEEDNYCSLLRTEDFSKIFYYLFLNEKAYNQDVNITGPRAYTWESVIRTIYAILGADSSKIVHIPKTYIAEYLPSYRDFLLRDRSLDAVFNLKKLIRIVPEAEALLNDSISLQDGIQRAIDYYRKNKDKYGVDYVYDAQIDRLISTYLKKNKKQNNDIHFIDYLGNNSLKEKMYYYVHRYFDDKTIRVLKKLK